VKNQLTDKEISLLIRCLKKYEPDYISKIQLLDHLSINEINKIRILITKEFSEKGLMENDEPNEYGMELEELIDKLARLYIWPDKEKLRKMKP